MEESSEKKYTNFVGNLSRNIMKEYKSQSIRRNILGKEINKVSKINFDNMDNSTLSENKRVNFSSLGASIIKQEEKMILSRNLNKYKHNIYNTANISNKKSYDPYLMKVCKNAIVNVSAQLPNYLEIIDKINKEFNINENEENENFEFENENDIELENSKINLSNINDESKKHINNLSSLETNYNESQINRSISVKVSRNRLAKSNDIINEEEKKINEEKIQKELEKEKEEQRKLEMRKKRKRILINVIRYLSANNIKVDEYIENNPFPKKPFEIRGSEEFLEAVKFNKYDLVVEAVKKDKRYLYQFDYNKQTCFHWSAKLGYDKLLRFLCENGSQLNSYDRKMRTPIFLATIFDQVKCIEILLEFGANAYICDINGKKPIDVVISNKARNVLNYAVEKPYNDIYNKSK